MSKKQKPVEKEFETVDDCSRLDDYDKCAKKAYMYGRFAFVTGTFGAFVLQEFYKKQLPYPRVYRPIVPVAAGALIGYALTARNLNLCDEESFSSPPRDLPPPRAPRSKKAGGEPAGEPPSQDDE